MMNGPIAVASTPTSASDIRFTQTRPLTPSFFEVEAQIGTPNVLVQIQRYRWDEPLLHACFSPRVCYLDLALIHRPPPVEAALRLGAQYTPPTATGDCVFMPAGSELVVNNPSLEHRVVCCLFDPRKFEEYLDVEWAPYRMSACFDIRNPNIRHGLRRLAEEALAPGFASEFLVETTVCSLVVELARHFRGVRNTENKTGGVLSARQLRLIDERVQNLVGAAPTLDELAALCCVTSRHLTRAYKNSTGKTLGEFIADARIRQAKSLLSSSNVMIKTVAYNTGFQNPAAFTAAFRKATGWSPQQFRKEVLGLID